MLLVMNNTDNFDLENKSRVSPDSADSNKTRVSNDDDVVRPVNDRNALSGGDHKSGVSEYDSMLSMFDEYAGSGNFRVTGAKQGYEIGDMVWGKVKSHPWWPGHVYDEAFASASVRRSKRKGFVLVAFFGDSSYGWFDPDELIPFEPHFAEKSKQINSKVFLKAVEEAADEASRRRGLGLACRCRNPYNFRPVSVKGYVAVDVGDNEPPAVYSTDQIKKARDDFRARDVIAFMRGLAVMPKRHGRRNLNFLKDKASVLAYRRAVYEEFDETYAQAFGQAPVQLNAESREALMHSVKAPLSGPMVIAETLGKRKTPIKSNKKDHKDKYLFKRRDEAKELKSQETGQTTSFMQQPYVEASAESVDGDYVLQRRAPPVPPDQQTPGEQATAVEDNKPSGLEDFMVKSPIVGDRLSDPTKGGVSLAKKGDQSKSNSNDGHKHAFTSKSVEGQDSRKRIEAGIKKAKNLKRPAGDLDPDRSVSGENKKKKKKDSGVDISSDHMQKLGPAGELSSDRSVTGETKRKKKNDAGVEMSSDHMQKLGPAGEGGVSGMKVSKKSVVVDIEPQKKGVQEDESLPNSVVKPEIKLGDLLADLYSLALNPFHGRERNSPAFVRQAFLKFRSLVFQKSLALSTPSEVDPSENPDAKPGKSSDNIRSAIKDQPSSKTPKPLSRPEDPRKGGQKRGPSDRQEEIAAKRLKKVTELKSLTVGKKAWGGGKDSVVARPPKLVRTEAGKKQEAPRKVRELTMLVMKFPPQSTLPSENELKARLARFGPLDHSRMRIFWKSFTCRVVFIYKADAEAAYRYLTENNNMFGSVRVRCHTRPLETPGPPDSETKTQREDGHVESSGDFRAPSTQSALQIKSCLKKPTTGEAGLTPGGNGGSKGAARVKFVSGVGENSGGGEPSVNRNNLNNSSFADVGNIGSSSSAISVNSTFGVDLISKNFQQRVVPQNPMSNFHSPQAASQISNAPINSHYPLATQPTFSRKFNANMFGIARAGLGSSSTNTDVAQEMLSLMTRCNDVVINLKSSLGYVPYYSL